MKKQVIATAVGLVLVGAALYGAYQYGVTRGTQSSQSSTLPGAASALKAGDTDPKAGKKILYWHDPMVPGQRFDKPGKSPFMDMQLVPVYADGDGGGSGGNGVVVDSHVAQNLGIRTAEVKPSRMSAVLEAPGNVAINERSVQVIQARTNGFVQHVAVKATLDPVRRGQGLVTLYSPDWVAAQEEYLAVSRMAGGEHSDLRGAARARMLQAGMTPGQVSAVESSGKLQPNLGIVSPVDGLVTEVAVREGMTVSPGMTMFRLADLSQVWVIAEVPEAQARTIGPGMTVTVSPTGSPEPLVGKVDTILPDVNPATRTIKVRIVLPNKGRHLLPGMFVTVRFDSGDQKEALVIPLESVIRTGQRTIVMVDAGKAGYVATEVKTGREAAGMVEILSGLQAGQKVVTSGQFLIDSEASLRGTTERMSATPAASAPAAAAAAVQHEGIGRIEAVTGEGLTISHGPIPSAQWGAMTMDFAAPPAGLPKAFKPGDRIRFRFHLNSDGLPILSSVEAAAGVQGAKP
ncbi:efflux RND transporter periplasmic adaptor subunit [Cupriavidus taiwanensis]|uniref:efflux RND transporter periplasmic adaptor subunit n=1 Tax=Cupriavidus taiwanensis TaxID=164546 RepID=UPI000E1A03B5|nr:efflux RND transporter periplasmic adaptor subunit [Cupriavidus taiwanensis]SOY44444.1 Efflux transporter, RND family, MFP subunit [Cupriavidus taiwanensis]